MRRTLTCLLSLFVAAAMSWTATRIHAQQGETNFAELYQRWQQAGDAEQIIALGEQILAREPMLVRPLSVDTSRAIINVRFGLGSAYVARQRGIRADNLEKGIAHLQIALTALTREAEPQSWGRAHNNIGIAYSSRIRGERSDNQEYAIAHFEQALTFFARESAGREWAQLQNNLAVVYLQRIRGERADNQEQAISHLEAALTIFTRETEPLLWAQAKMNLGSTYRSRANSDRAENLEEAKGHIEAAMSVLTRDAFPYEWATAQTNLANIYLARTRGDRAGNQQMAMAAYATALTVFTKDAFPQQWATAQRGLGNAYADRIEGVRAMNRGKAIAAYEAALSVFTGDALPFDQMQTARLLGRTLLDAGAFRRAGQAYGTARDAFLLLFSEGLEDASARNLITEAGPLFAEAAFAALQGGDAEAAILLADEGRARLLAVAIKLQNLELSAKERRKFEELRVGIRAEQHLVETARGAERASALEKLAAFRQTLRALVKRRQGSLSGPALLPVARELVAEGTVIAVPIVTGLGAKIVLLSNASTPNGISVIDLPALTTERLSELLIGHGSTSSQGWIGSYFINYLAPDEQLKRWPEWLAAIEVLGAELWDLFGGKLDAALKDLGVKPNARLIWLPSGWLSVLPIGLAQNPISKRRLGDDNEIAYAPSLEALAAARRDSAKQRPATLAAVINPTEDLPGTEAEGSIVASHFARSTRTLLERWAATPDAVLAALKGRTHWHFASHGVFSWADARQSGLLMHGQIPLSVGKFLDTDGLGRPQLVVLSACETGLIDITKSPDEFLGLPGAFMALGAVGVVGTLWPVSDEATALLMARYYELHIDVRLSPITALHRAQAWLRESTAQDLRTFVRNAAQWDRLSSRQLVMIEQALSTRVIKGDPTNSRPYAHPYYWAGFVHTGL